MISIPKNYYSNLSCYEEFVIRTNLLGYDVSNDELYECLIGRDDIRLLHGNFYFFSVGNNVNRHLCIIDRKGNHIENAVIEGGFDCSLMNLTSLKGAPREVCGYFDCSENNLTSLEGSPKKVGGYFWCLGNNLTSLEGAPKKVDGDFYCFGNKLTDNQIKEYKKWLKTNPSSSYHDPDAT